MPAARLPRLNAYQRLTRRGIRQLFTAVLIPLFWRLYGPAGLRTQLADLQQLPVGTLGRSVADCLRAHNLQLIPGYEDHDLKHVLLGYGMTPEDELRLKAFTVGNGDHTPSSLGLLLMGVLLPDLWAELWTHFQRGRRARPMYHWRLSDYAHRDLAELRREIGLTIA